MKYQPGKLEQIHQDSHGGHNRGLMVLEERSHERFLEEGYAFFRNGMSGFELLSGLPVKQPR